MFEIRDPGLLVVNGKDEYLLRRMRSIYVKRLGVREQLVRCLSCGLAFASVSCGAAYWIAVWVPYLSLLFFAIGLLWSLCTFRRFELRAVFKAVDETGDFDVAIARGVRSQLLPVLDDVVNKISAASKLPT